MDLGSGSPQWGAWPFFAIGSTRMRNDRFAATVVFLAACLPIARSAEPDQSARPIRYMLHGNMTYDLPTEDYLRFVERVKPDILIMGVFDQRLYATVAPGEPKPKTRPLPLAELIARWKAVADRLHLKGIRLVGQMELNVLSDWPGDLP